MQVQLAQLMQMLESREEQQIKLPLDESSKAVVYENVPLYVSEATGTPTPGGTISVKINGRTYSIITE